MARPKKPIAMLKAEGKSHLSKREIAEREEMEIDVPFTDVKPPKYLKKKKHVEEFNHYASMLLKIGILTELDVDCLANYILSKELYITYTNQLEKVMAKANAVRKWAVIDDLAEMCGENGTLEELHDLLEKILRRQRGDDALTLMNLQDKAFKQMLACTREMGLTIAGRLKLAVPPPPDDESDEL